MANKGKQKFFDINNLALTFKGVVSNIVASLIVIPTVLISGFFIRTDAMELALLTLLAGGVGYLFLWGFTSNRLWGWK